MSNEKFEDVPVIEGELVGPEAGGVPAVRQGSQAMVQTRTQFQMAVRPLYPRKMALVRQNVEAEALQAREHFYYRFPAGGGKIEGATIGLLECVARYMGNLSIDVAEEIEDGKWKFTHHVVDLETGYNATHIYRASIPTSKHGKFDMDRTYTMKHQAALSKARRNALKMIVPGDIISSAIKTAQDAVVGDVANGLDAAKKSMVAFFAGYGVNTARIEKVIGPLTGASAVEIAELRNYARQIKDGEVAPEDIFPATETEPANPKAENKAKPPKAKAEPTPPPEPPATEAEAVENVQAAFPGAEVLPDMFEGIDKCPIHLALIKSNALEMIEVDEGEGELRKILRTHGYEQIKGIEKTDTNMIKNDIAGWLYDHTP